MDHSALQDGPWGPSGVSADFPHSQSALQSSCWTEDLFMPSHPLCVGRHVWIRRAMWGEAPSLPCRREKGHHAPRPFSCMFKHVLTNLVQSDCSMKPNVMWTGIALQIRCSSGVNQHHPIGGHGPPPVELREGAKALHPASAEETKRDIQQPTAIQI